MAPLSFAGPLPKKFRRGTHRSAAPSDTLMRVRPFSAQMGITRVGNITGLDRIGIPVVVAVRPNSRSVAVSQGKGPTLGQALTSALMEATELFHAEDVRSRTRRATFAHLAADNEVLDPN